MPKEIREILLSGVVGFDITVESIKQALDDANGEDIRFLISSGGGSVFQGLAISNLIQNFPGKTESRIIGLAASMATVIALAADKVTAEDDAVFMIHNASGGAFGSKHEMAKMQAVLEKIDNMIVNKYADKTGRAKAELKKEMDNETFFFGSEMKKAGFVDEMLKGKGKDKKAALDDALLEVLAAMEASDKEKGIDIDQVAAYLKPEVDAGGVEVHDSEERRESANNKPKEEETMNWEEFFNDPKNKDRLEALLTEAKEKGAASVKASIEAVKPFITADYPDAVKAQAIKVLDGEVSAEMFQMAVAMFDLKNEGEASNDASQETTEQGKTPAHAEKENEVENNYQARFKRLKGGN